MLLVPWIVGCGVAGGVSPSAALVLVALVALFLAHHHAMAWWRLRQSPHPDAAARRRPRRSAALLGLLTFIIGAWLVLADRSPAYLVLGAMGGAVAIPVFALITRHEDHALPGQVLAAIGLTLSAPAAWYAVTGGPWLVGAALWVLNAAYFLGAVWHVRILLAARRRKIPLDSLGQRLGFAVPTIAVELLVLSVAAASLRMGGLSIAAIAGFAPLLVQLAVDVFGLDRPRPLKQVGLWATVSSMLFAALVIALA